MTTADHALLDAATVDEFCATPRRADIAIGVVERANADAAACRTRSGPGSSFAAAPTPAPICSRFESPAVAPAIELWRSVEQDRKKGWRLFSLFGPVVLLGVALRLLSLDQVLTQLGRSLG